MSSRLVSWVRQILPRFITGLGAKIRRIEILPSGLNSQEARFFVQIKAELQNLHDKLGNLERTWKRKPDAEADYTRWLHDLLCQLEAWASAGSDPQQWERVTFEYPTLERLWKTPKECIVPFSPGGSNQDMIDLFRKYHASLDHFYAVSFQPSSTISPRLVPETSFSGRSDIISLEESIKENLAQRHNRALQWRGMLRTMSIQLTPSRLSTDPPMNMDERIKIAVLDTGIDINNPWINVPEQKQRVEWRDFTASYLLEPEDQDPERHGTKVSQVLLDLTNNTSIFVARVSKNGYFSPRAPARIAEAIRHAVDRWHVDIISISFGFEGLAEHLECIQDALLYAHYKKVVVFAAAHNDGGRRPIAYPADRLEVICIHAADAAGKPADFTPYPVVSGENFAALGVQVPLEALGRGGSAPAGGSISVDGTSFATPIAAAIAATVMEYVLTKTASGNRAERYFARRIKTRSGIVKVFKDHLSKPVSGEVGYRCLVPWIFFKQGAHVERYHPLLATLEDA